MDADFVKAKLELAAQKGQPFSLLLRGAHTLEASRARVTLVPGSNETRFEIAGRLAADGREPIEGSAFVSSGDIAALIVRDV